jgi:hypothetical protein
VFRGTYGSLGYRKGKTYQLILKHLSAMQQFTKNWEYEIEDANRGGGYCPYTNIFTFLENWRPL